MKTVILRNKSDKILRVMLEPWAEIYDIPVGVQVDIVTNLNDGEIDFEVDFENDSFLGIWVPDGTKLLLDGIVMQKLRNT